MFTDTREFFPKQQTHVLEHLHKAIQFPIIIHHMGANLTFSPLFKVLMLLLIHRRHIDKIGQRENREKLDKLF